jgi:outer membrane protein TolC
VLVRRLLLNAVTFGLAAPGLLAQAPPPTGALTPSALAPYVTESLERNLALARQRLATRQTASDRDAARGRFLPSVGVESRYSELSGVVNIGDFINPAYATLNQLVGSERFPTDINATLPFRHQSFIRLTQPLLNPAVRAGYDVADALHGAQGAALDGAMRDLAAQVQRALLGYASADRVVDLRRSTLPVLDEYLRTSERLVAAGAITADVVLRARAEQAEARQALVDAERERDDARRVVNLLLDRELDAALTLDASVLELPPLGLNDEDLVRSALARRPELAQLAQIARVSSAQARLATSSFTPTVALAVDYGVQGDQLRFRRDEDFVVASVVLSWNLFNGGQDAARRQRAQLEQGRTALQQREAERAVELEVRRALAAVQAAANADRAAADRVDAARSAFALTARRYDEGLAAPLDFLSARAALTAAELNAVLTRTAHVLQRVELERATALRPLPR